MKEIIRENTAFLKQILKLSKSELVKTYKGAALGPAWAIIRPAVTIFVYWFAFDVGLRGGSSVEYNGIESPFIMFLIAGILPWFFMRDALLNGAGCFRKYSQYITKMPFPVSTIPTFKLLSDLYSHIGLTVVTYIVLICIGMKPSIYNIQLLFYMPIMYIFFLCVSWFTAPLSAISKDFLNVINSIMIALFWVSGIIWDAHALQNPILRRIILATPITYFANGYRNSLLFETWFFETRFETFCLFIWLVVFMFLGSYTYKRLRKTIPDVL